MFVMFSALGSDGFGKSAVRTRLGQILDKAEKGSGIITRTCEVVNTGRPHALLRRALL